MPLEEPEATVWPLTLSVAAASAAVGVAAMEGVPFETVIVQSQRGCIRCSGEARIADGNGLKVLGGATGLAAFIDVLLAGMLPAEALQRHRLPYNSLPARRSFGFTPSRT